MEVTLDAAAAIRNTTKEKPWLLPPSNSVIMLQADNKTHGSCFPLECCPRCRLSRQEP